MIIRRGSISLSLVHLHLMRHLAASYPCFAGGVGRARDVISLSLSLLCFLLLLLLLLARHGARSLSRSRFSGATDCQNECDEH